MASRVLWVGGLWLSVAVWTGYAAAQDQTPTLQARLLAGASAIAPGGELPIALELTVTEGWHVYHPILLDTGKETTIRSTLSSGVTLDAWRFPEPRLKSQFDMEYLELSGTFYVLTSARLAPDAPREGAATIELNIRALACIEKCIPVDAAASLEVPIAAAGTPQNEEIFAKARRGLPPPLADAEYLAGSRLLVKDSTVPVGGRSEVVAVLNVTDGFHIQDRRPSSEDFVPTRVLIETVNGVLVKEGDQLWPPASEREVQYLGRLREQQGEVVVRAPFTINDAKFEPRPVTLRVLVQYQACSENGTCFQPMWAAGTVSFDVVPADQAATPNPEYAKLKLPTPAGAEGDAEAAPQVQRLKADLTSLWWVYAFAFLGGVILNIMPCVLPVIAIKIFGFVGQAHESRGRIFALGLTYGAGVLCSFVPLAIMIGYFGGAWGTLLQSSTFVIVLISAVFAFALSLLGVFEIQLPGNVQNAASSAGAGEGFGSAFLNGAFATALATPCVGPFLGSALGVLATLPSYAAALGIMVVGVGLAFPYMLLTAFPGWLKLMPKPGAWMHTFKQAVGFIMMLVVAWLLWILGQQVDDYRLFATVTFLVFVGIACWQVGRIGLTASWGRTLRGWGAAAVLLALGWFGAAWWFQPPTHQLDWRKWEPGIGPRLAAEGQTVYIDYTARWCLTCQQNKALALDTRRTVEAFRRDGVVAVKADFTDYDDAIKKELNALGSNGVPLNVIYPAGRPEEPVVLPTILTGPGAVLDALERSQAAATAGRLTPAAAASAP